jgi:hypothetical protein
MAEIYNEPASEVASGLSSGASSIDTSGEFLHLPKKERKRAKLIKKEAAEKWRRAAEIRAGWGEPDFAVEEARLREEVRAILELRDAA